MVTFAQAALNIDAFGTRAMTAGAPAAARRMAECGRDADRIQLTLTAHGEGTRSPAPVPASPSEMTGALAAAQAAGEPFPLTETVWEAHAGPTSAAASSNGPYGRFLQFGGTHEAHTPGRPMKWFEDGQWHSAYVLKKEPRPYLTYALDQITADGSLHDAAVEGFAEGMGF